MPSAAVPLGSGCGALEAIRSRLPRPRAGVWPACCDPKAQGQCPVQAGMAAVEPLWSQQDRALQVHLLMA